MDSYDLDAPARTAFCIEEASLGLFKRGLSVLTALFAVVAEGAGTALVVNKKVLIKDIESDRVLKEITDSMVDLTPKLRKDVNSLSVRSFIEEWLPELQV